MSTIANEISSLLHTLSNRIETADSSDFGVLAVTVIISVWYVNRYLGD